MRQSHRLALMVLVMVVLSVSAASFTAAQSARTSYHNLTGKVRFVGASVSNPVLVAQAATPGLSIEARAKAILDVYAPQFGAASSDLVFASEVQADANRISRRYNQVYQGIPVFGGQVVLNMTPSGGLVSMQGELSPDLAVNIVPSLTAAQAQQMAVQKVAKDYAVAETTLLPTVGTLVIYDARLVEGFVLPPTLAWRVDVASTVGAPINAAVLLDAQTGNLLMTYNQVKSFAKYTNAGSITAFAPLPAPQADVRVPGVADLSTHDANNANSLPGTFVCDETDLTCTEGADPDADAAHLHANGVYDMYWDWHGRDSLNDGGMLLRSTVHYSSGYCNAFWNGSQMAYGDGCPSTIVLDDVVSHELTHGVTDFTSNLIYANQSGAINESLSDVWGEYYDLTNGTPEDTPANRWRVGEELNLGGPYSGIRDMKDPTLFRDPDRTQSQYWYNSVSDGGGVHSNSGVNNKAAYLIADGDTFNGYTITGIGILKAAVVYYDSQTTKLGPSSDYLDLYDALNQSCTELIGGPDGITAADCTQVMNATLATEMNIPAQAHVGRADICDFGGTPSYLFFDDLESGTANWTTGATTGSNAWTIASTSSPLYGGHSNLGVDQPSNNASFAAMVSDVSVTAGTYLYFEHRYVFEAGEWDGGFLQYSTNGGSSWTYLDSDVFFDAGQDYLQRLTSVANGSTNPFAGTLAYVNTSNPSEIASTRFDLSSLAGQNVRIRWMVTADSNTGAAGWRVDEIGLYTCSGGSTPTPTETNTPGGPTETPTATNTPGGPTETPTETPTGEAGIELVVNGGFETLGTDGKPDVTPWAIKNATGDKAKCNKDKDGDGIPDKIFANSGDCAFVFKGVVGEAGKIQQTLDLSAVIPAAGDALNLSFFAQGKSGATVKTKVVFKYGDDTKTKITVESDGTETYAEFMGSETLTSADVTKAKINVGTKSTSGKVNVDDVSLKYVPAGSRLIPLPQTNGLSGRN